MSKPMGRPPSPDAVYAAELKLDGFLPKRKVQRLGGADKLKTLDPDARALLLKPQNYGNSQTIHNGGLAARGMGQRRGYKPRGDTLKDQAIEARIQRILVERGLVKSD